MGTVILMSGTLSGGSVNGIVSIDVPLTGVIEGVLWQVDADLDADAEVVQVQVSFGSVFNSSNDSRQVISMIRGRASILTAVGAVPVNFSQYHPLNLGVTQGERIFMHENSTAGVTGSAIAMVSFDFDIDRPLARRR